MSNLLVYVREGIVVYFGIFLSGESVPGVGLEMVESVMECGDGK